MTLIKDSIIDKQNALFWFNAFFILKSFCALESLVNSAAAGYYFLFISKSQN